MSKLELLTMLDRYIAADDDERKPIEFEIADKFSMDRTVLVLDMSGFTRRSDQYGIIFYLALIRQMNRTAKPIVERHGGQIVKFEADNVFAIFDEPKQAVDAAIAMNIAFYAVNEFTSDERDIEVSIGIDVGSILYVEDHHVLEGSDIYGEAVNRACKLGEDIAERREILITDRAFQAIPHRDAYRSEARRQSVSGITLDYHFINAF